jgi:hypothetical protein
MNSYFVVSKMDTYNKFTPEFIEQTKYMNFELTWFSCFGSENCSNNDHTGMYTILPNRKAFAEKMIMQKYRFF